MGFVTTNDGTQIYYKDWGTGPPVVLSHGWPLSSDSWEAQMLFLAEHGYRCVAHDRRGHGRSSQPWDGNEMDTYADDLAALIDGAALKVYAGAPHGITDTHKEQLGADLLAFLDSTLERTTDDRHRAHA